MSRAEDGVDFEIMPNLKTVPAALRRLAESIECGEVDIAASAIVVTANEDNELAVYGYGDVGSVDAVAGRMIRAAHKVCIDDFGDADHH